MTDPVFEAFLSRQRDEVLALAAASDLIRVFPAGGDPPDRYRAEFACRGLVRHGDRVLEASRFEVGIWLPGDYLRTAERAQVLTWLGPPGVFHPNITPAMPFICVGPIAAGTPVVDLLHRCFEIITWQRVTMREDDALNPWACSWARAHQARLPVDRRPLKWRKARAGSAP